MFDEDRHGSAEPDRAASHDAVGGRGFAVAALLLLVPYGVGPYTDGSTDLLLSPVARATPSLLLLGSTIVLAFGLPGERGVVGRPIPARIGLIAFGGEGIALIVLGAIAGGLLQRGVGQPALLMIGSLGLALKALAAAGCVVAAIGVVRAGVLRGAARWALLAVAVADVVVLGLELVPSGEVAYAVAMSNAGVLLPLALLAAGAAFAVHGVVAALRRPPRVGAGEG